MKPQLNADGIIVIPGVAEPGEMLVPPYPKTVKGPAILELAGLMKANKETATPSLDEIDQVLNHHPDFALGHLMKAGLLCMSGDRRQIPSEIDAVLKYPDQTREFDDFKPGMYLSLKAEVEHEEGDDTAALADLSRAIDADPGNATNLANGGGVRPDLVSKNCSWSVEAVDGLVAKFPHDDRPVLFRGLFYGAYAKYDPASIPLAKRDLEAAIAINPNSARNHYLYASTLAEAYLFKLDQDKPDGFNAFLERQYSTALQLDPKYLPALISRSSLFYELKRSPQAIADYSAALDIDPTNEIMLNDRGLAKVNTGDTYSAVLDFTSSIAHKKREVGTYSSYENRGDAYLKLRQYNEAIDDYTAAISSQAGSLVLSSNIDQFRRLYPEYAGVSSTVIADKLAATFWPDLDKTSLESSFLTGKKTDELNDILGDLILKRAKAYAVNMRWGSAARDYRRVVVGITKIPADRWVGLDDRTFLDLKTFDASRPTAVSFWLKQIGDDSNANYTVTHYTANCTTKRVMVAGGVTYNGSDQAISTTGAGAWDQPVPDSRGEVYLTAACSALNPFG